MENENAYFPLEVAEDGTLTIPAFAMRGLDYSPGDHVELALPMQVTECEGCMDLELYMGSYCSNSLCCGYGTCGNTVNIPPKLFDKAGVPLCTDVYVMAGDKALVLVAGYQECGDLPAEICELLHDLGIKVSPPVPLDRDF